MENQKVQNTEYNEPSDNVQNSIRRVFKNEMVQYCTIICSVVTVMLWLWWYTDYMNWRFNKLDNSITLISAKIDLSNSINDWKHDLFSSDIDNIGNIISSILTRTWDIEKLLAKVTTKIWL